MTVRAVLFDLFDTLVDIHMDRLPETTIRGRRVRSTYGALHEELQRSQPVDFETFSRELRAVDREWQDLAYKEGLEMTTEERFQRLLVRLEIDDATLPGALRDVHMGKLEEQVETLDHHVEVLEGLRRGVRLGVCSNFTDTPTAHRVLERSGLMSQLDGVVISADVGYRKPRPEMFVAALACLGACAEETVHVGDNLDADVRGAMEVGMRTVWIHRRVADPQAALEKNSGPEPTARLGDLRELPEVLERLS